MSNGTLRILLADDHALVREGLKRLVNDQRDMLVVGEAADGPEALLLAQQLAPAVALVDVSMPTWDGVKTTKMLRAACPHVKVIAVSRHGHHSFVTKMIEAGASGYVLKQSSVTELIAAIRAVAGGEQHIDAAIQLAVGPSAATSRLAPPAVKPQQAMSAMEQQVLRLIALARSTQQIAEALAIQPDAVAAAKATAMQKAGLVTRLDVIRYAKDRGWTPSTGYP